MAAGIPKGYDMFSLPTMGPGQKSIYDLLGSQFKGGAGDVYQKLFGMASGKSEAFAPQEQQALDFFNQKLAPQIAGRYAGSGISGSSGMQNAIAGAAGNLTTNLQAQRNQMMQQSIHDVLGLGNMLLGTPTQQFGLVQKDNILKDLMQLLGVTGGAALSFI